MHYRFKEIVIDETAAESPLAERVLAALPGVPVFRGDTVEIRRHFDGIDHSRGKRIIHITTDRGHLVKPCPATNPPYLCCRYTVINSANQCPMDCSYCVLQAYLERPLITLFANTGDIMQEIAALQRAQPRRFFRFGTGELADSLALDRITGQSREFISFFNSRRNCLLELKTKTDHVDALLTANPANSVIAWSMNAKEVVRREELRAAPVNGRLDAAERCQERGFLLAFHFDPIVQTEQAGEGYREMVDALFRRIDPGRIAWISLGALRYPPSLREVMLRRFPESSILYDEMIRGRDGKMRYLRPKRIGLFRTVYDRIREYSRDLFIYFCMEPPWVWDAVTGFHPSSNADLDFRFAESLHRRFPEIDMDRPLPEYYQ
ncbi:hypothetical protein JXO52_14270 [bacterium]|nr:hypothetical protein [bacterium]